ncbi:hypothetical protein T440DRAFT_501055 [Plenodomus tracheiphilus IPT5]|uniref:Uncharacterized protein n=1 Tax=Plenodomus tracheiphilus IPT5 TaxID=1408161 RepID=A0A6A7AX65_9PLEO|nr:hypothetical protein T440DRAFT_501055 [Plenodomus tracheiphilus IPT5]
MSSVASSVDFYESEAASATDAPNVTSSTKRKADELSSSDEKKRRLDPPVSASPPNSGRSHTLPPELWQHVFSFCSLADLGRLIQVNRSFLHHLTDVREASTSKSDCGRLHLLKSESLWASARNALSTKPPKPLPGFTELQMCQLAWSKRCQFCNKLPDFTPGERIWQKGPGDAGVRTIWPFAIRSCGPCLMERCQTDSSLLFSAASALRPALPFVLLTNDHHYITAYTLQSATTPADIVIGKYYYKEHVTEIAQELADALSLGSAAAEEWSKGLEARGRDRMRVAENWERWEVKHHWWEEHQDTKRATSAAPSTAATSHREGTRSPPRHASSPVIHAPVPASKYTSVTSFAFRVGGTSQCFIRNTHVPALTAVVPTYQHAQVRPPTVPPQVFTPQPTGSTAPGGRNLQDANEAKANRKLDIERRCEQMDPAIPPNILRHMDSFKAAIQISQPMTDYAWSVLQPRLLAQLPAAQQAEADHVARVAALPTKTADRRQPDVNSKEAKEVMDREWDESQRPVRDRLGAIADDFIKQDWDHGIAVTYENSPKFAADLLIHLRRTYYAQNITEDEPTSDAHGNGLTNKTDTTPKLVLDNLKWAYDNKIKPITEQFRKDIFLCYGNGCESNTRFYGFEGVIQHYGAKHTNTFSVGNIVVAWREAEWPEETPFHPDPISVKHTYHPSASTTGLSGYSGYSRAGTSTPHMPPHLPQASPGPYGYGGPYNGPFAPPQTPLGALQGYGYPQQYATPGDGYAHQAMGPPTYGQPTPHSYLQSPAMIGSAIAPPPVVPSIGQGIPEPQPGIGEDTGHSTSSFDKEVSTVISLAQDIWKKTSGIKDMPNSLRVYVLLHRIIFKFQVEFNHEPSLNHFIDALSSHGMPKALKNAPGLSCKACQTVAFKQQASAYYARSEERRTYTGLNLLSHFRSQHLPFQSMGPAHGQMPSLDWKEDMIELPSERFISGLIHAPGMDDEKLLLVARVFPKHFPMPLPKIGVIDSHGVASPASSGPKDMVDAPGPTDTEQEPEKARNAAPGSGLRDSSQPSTMKGDEYDPRRPALATETIGHASTQNRKRYYEESPPASRRQRFQAESQYYMSREAPDDDYTHQQEYMEYGPSPRIAHARPMYDEYTGRRAGFRGQDRFYGPPPEHVVYAHTRDGSHGGRERDYGAYSRRYYEDEDSQPEYRYISNQPSREQSPHRGQTAADRFLDEFVPNPAPPSGPVPVPTPPEPAPTPSAPNADDGSRYTPTPPNVSAAGDAGPQIRPLAPPHPRAPSTVSNGSRYDEYYPPRHMPAPEFGTSRRTGPHRRRDRPHEQRMPSRYYRYMNVAQREDRGSSMSRSQSRRYEEQRRRIDQQETPQPGAISEYEPAYSRDASVEHPSPEHNFQQPPRRVPGGYVSVQDRYHQSSPPRIRYEDHRRPQTVYVDEYGHPIHDFEVVHVRADHRQPRGPYMHQPPRYEQDHYQYVPVPYERPPPQRYNSREQHYMYYDERERPLPRRPAPEPEAEFNEPLPPEIKVESVPVAMPEAT